MRRAIVLSLFLSSASVLCLLSCKSAPLASAQDHDHAGPTVAIAVMVPTAGSKTHGTVRFTQMGDKLKVVAEVEGLTPGQKHAIHVHEFGDISAPDGTATGGHYNPENHEHALPEKPIRHAGDLGNLQGNAEGKAKYEIMVDNMSLAGKNPVLGRGVIIHAKVDDGGQPTGNAGGRIAQGVIGIAKAAP